MKIIQLAYSNYIGGASKAAYRIHYSLCKNNIDSELWVNETSSKKLDCKEGNLDYSEFTDEKSLRLGGKARDYEYIILGDIFDSCENKMQLLKMYYRALENSANIIILAKKSHNSTEEIKSLLDKSHFLAINDIDLFDDYIIITAKKYHMWGNGL